ncbi:MAG TPA: prepilin peptidase [Bryobacteraceae bacterium]|nr:prepilin peptidase [Bryobacteraceae bacterium]
MTALADILQLAAALLTVTAALTDLRSRTIPNWLVVTGLIAGFLLNIYLDGWAGLRLAAGGFGLALLIYVPMYMLRAMGGGDVKLMAAVGSITGAHNWFLIFLFTSMIGGVIALIFLLFRGRLGRSLQNVGYILHEMLHLRAPHASRSDLDIGGSEAVTMPHGVAISLGTLMFLMLLRGGFLT